MKPSIPKVALLLCLVTELASSSCIAPAPISLPITDVLLENGQTRKGIPLSFGSPAQNLSVLPHGYLNNTWLYNTTATFCDNTNLTDQQCYTERGGFYNPTKSSTAQRKEDVQDAGGSPTDTDRAVGTHVWFSEWVTDTVEVDNVTLTDFPIGMPGLEIAVNLEQQSFIGLSTNSTLLSRLKDSNSISSRVYSYWWGQETAVNANQMDGSIVFGGYDAAKVQGENQTFNIQPTTTDCPSGMYVTVTGMDLVFPNGTKSPLVDPRGFVACISLDYFPTLMTWDNDWFSAYQAEVPDPMIDMSLGIHWWSPRYHVDDVYSGGLEVTVAGGLSFEFQNDIIVVPDTYIGSDGTTITNTTVSDFLVTPKGSENADNPTLLGSRFFQSAYLMVDLDRNTFTMWQANPTTETKLVAVGGSCKNAVQAPSSTMSPGNNTASNPGTTTTATTSTVVEPHDPTNKQDTSISTGAIAGIAVGCACGAAAVAAIVVIIVLRRRRMSKLRSGTSDGQNRGDFDESSRDGASHLPSHDYRYDGPKTPLMEMPGIQSEVKELDSTSKPSELSNWDRPKAKPRYQESSLIAEME